MRPSTASTGPITAAVSFALTLCATTIFAATGCMNHGIPRDRTVEATLSSTSTVTSLPASLRVVAFNVHGRSGEVITRALRDDRALQSADVIFMEEVHADPGCSAACVVAKQLGFHAVYSPGFVDRGGTNGVAILSRAPIRSAEIIELPQYNVHFNNERTTALAATVLVEDQPVTLYAVHLTNRITVAERRRQMQPVLEHASRQATPVLIAGDFNTSPFTWIAHVIPVLTTTQDDHFEALMRAHGFATPVADSGPTSRYLAMKLDGIYTRDFSTAKFATAMASSISDHMALWAQVTRNP